MKKSFAIILVAAVVMMASCKKNDETQGVTLKASIEQHKSDGSKTSLNPADLTIAWTMGDKILVNNGTSSVPFTLSGNGGATGTFVYNGEYTFGENNVAVYPETATVSGTTVNLTLPAEQDLDEPNSFANGANPMLASFTDANDLTFTSLCGVLGLQLTGDNIPITAIEIISKADEKLNGTFECTTTDPTLRATSANSGTNRIKLNCTTTLTSEAKKFYIVLPVGTLSSGFFMNVYDGDNVIFDTDTDTNLTTVLNTVKTMNALEVTVETGDTHEYVDLGLPSGLLWATCNVGANSPEECGNYYAWGETQPKDYYGWENYLFYGEGEYPWITCTKYNHNGLTLLPEDDPATQWGASWRMPTVEDWQELLDNTTNEWTTQNGVNGVLLTALNGNSLFLPETGMWYLNEIQFDYSRYWSSSVNYYWPNIDAEALAVRTWGGVFNIQTSRTARSSGLPVRPVRNAE